ncbi:MAG: arginine--tRNA ligase [Nibricoccus sp.]
MRNFILQNHLGDWGTQFGMLIAYLRDVGASEGGHIADLEDFYRRAKKRFDDDTAFQDEARKTVVKLQAGDPDILAAWSKMVDETRRHFQPLYERMGVLLKPEHERGESTYNPLLRGVVEALKASGLAIESDGAIGVFIDGEKKPPLIIEKTGGGFLYGTTDLAAIQYRVNDLKANRSIYFTDSRQAQHFSQVFRTADKAGWTKGASFEHAPFGTVLGKDNKPFKTRSGDTVKLKDLLDEAEQRALAIVNAKNADLPEAPKQAIAHAIGVGAVKYGDLSKDRTSDYVFDWDTMLAMEGNTAPYLQYAHAASSPSSANPGSTASAATNIALDAPQEIALAKHILRLGEVLENVARDLKPHLLCTYLYDLATRFSSFYENCPVLKSDEPVRSQRLALCDSPPGRCRWGSICWASSIRSRCDLTDYPRACPGLNGSRHPHRFAQLRHRPRLAPSVAPCSTRFCRPRRSPPCRAWCSCTVPCRRTCRTPAPSGGSGR